MKKIISAIFSVCAVVTLLSGCVAINEKDYSYSDNHHIIFDTDTAADDAMAIIMLSKAPNINIEGVTILAGNVSLEQASKNALMSLEVADKRDVPVYPTSHTNFLGEEISPYSVFGEDGMGDNNLIHPTNKPEESDGIDFIIDTVKKYPNEIEIVATGPLTNIAKAIEKDPETMTLVKHIWSMGTGGTRYLGNATPVAEFNAYLDIPAYKCVVDSKIPMTIVGYDVCDINEGVRIYPEDLDTISKAGECGEFISKALEGVLNYNIDCGYEYVQVCDPVLAASIIWDDFVTTENSHAEVISDESLAKGEVLYYLEDSTYESDLKIDTYDVNIATDLNDKSYITNVCKLVK